MRLSEVREDPDLGVQRCDGVGDRRASESGGHARGGLPSPPWGRGRGRPGGGGEAAVSGGEGGGRRL